MKAKKKRIDWKINKDVLETIPYKRVYQKENLIETTDGNFVRGFLLEDLNFSTSKIEDQEAMFLGYQSLLNSFPVSARIQVNIINKNIDKNVFKEKVLLPYHKDNLDKYREEYNKMLLNKMEQGKNNLTHVKMITVSIEADSKEEAEASFRQINEVVIAGVKKIGGLTKSTVKILTVAEHLEILHDIYNPDLIGDFNTIRNIDGQEVSSFSFENMVKQGLTTKDLVAPDSFEFKMNHFVVGNKVGRAFYIHNLPNWLSPKFLNELASNEVNQVISISYTQVEQSEAIKTIERHINALNSERIDKQKRGSKGGFDGDLMGVRLVEEVRAAEEFLRDMSKRNQKLFLMTGTIVVFADSEEELEKFSGLLVNIARRMLVNIKPLRFQQEQGLSQTLPLCRKDIFVERTLNSEAASIFIPFDSQDFSDEDGVYYGVNATSRNLVVFDRKKSNSQNGFVLGMTGSGKSFISKSEMVNVLLNTNDDIIVIDPEAEYAPLAELLGGAVVPLELGSDYYLNPLDMVENYGDSNDPIPAKSDFITQIIETLVGDLSSMEKSIIDRAVKELYTPYLTKIATFNKKNATIEEFSEYRKSITPTLVDLRNILIERYREREAQQLAIAIEQYTTGSFNLFSKKTNVKNRERFVVFDISSLGETITPLAMMVIMDSIWNRILENRNKGKNTWVYIDEIYLMFRREESAILLQNMWKRGRKYGGIFTGITQNIADLLNSHTAANMLSNSEFILMMNQAPLDKENLIGLLNISETQSSYISSSEPGQGLLYTGRAIVPFINKFPTDTELYKVMTSNAKEVKKFKEEREQKLHTSTREVDKND